MVASAGIVWAAAKRSREVFQKNGCLQNTREEHAHFALSYADPLGCESRSAPARRSLCGRAGVRSPQSRQLCGSPGCAQPVLSAPGSPAAPGDAPAQGTGVPFPTHGDFEPPAWGQPAFGSRAASGEVQIGY